MAVDSPVLLPVILCGGSGTRLWPLSRETYPKQFLALTGVHTLLQETVLRLHGQRTPLPVAEQPLLVCNVEHRFLAASQLQDVGIRGASILLEPEGRNTAPALTLAALHASASGADPVLIAMPADHVIADLPAFHSAAADAFLLAQRGGLVAFGIEVDRPETGYGYIRKGVAVEGMDGAAFDIASFSEKPDVVEAQAYLESGEHLWNSGLFMVRASVWLTAVGSCRPDILGACEDAMKDAKRDLDFVRPDAECFRACPTDSIDYAVMERLPDRPDLGVPAYVVPLRAGWSDIGAWDALWECRERDGNGNALVGDAVQHKCADTLLLSSNRLVVGVGLEQIFVVETPDAVLDGESALQPDQHSVADLTRSYIRSGVIMRAERHWTDDEEAPRYGNVVLRGARLLNAAKEESHRFEVKEDIMLEVDYDILDDSAPVNLHIHLKDLAGHHILVAMNNRHVDGGAQRKPGRYKAECRLRAPLLNNGDYRIDLEIWPGEPMDPKYLYSQLLNFTVFDNNAAAGVRGNWPNQWPNCLVRPDIPWAVTSRP